MMTDRQLLDLAGELLEPEKLKKLGSDDALKATTLASISASLLVIARNSIPLNVDVRDIHQAFVDESPLDDKLLDKETWMTERFKEYDKYWNPNTRLFEIEDDWKLTKDELLASIERGWEFEEGSKK